MRARRGLAGGRRGSGRAMQQRRTLEDRERGEDETDEDRRQQPASTLRGPERSQGRDPARITSGMRLPAAGPLKFSESTFELDLNW